VELKKNTKNIEKRRIRNWENDPKFSTNFNHVDVVLPAQERPDVVNPLQSCLMLPYVANASQHIFTFMHICFS